MNNAAASWQDALEIVVARTRHERYRSLCAEANPDIEQRDAYRALVIGQAAGESPAAPAPTPEDAAPRAHLARRGCCGG